MDSFAIFGGSFDPPHLGHMLIGRQIAETFGVGKVWFMPVRRSPLKDRGPIASDRDRVEMLRLSIGENSLFGISERELHREGKSFTVDTLRELRAEYPDARILFAAGMDSLLTLHAWKEPLALLDLCEFVTFRRPMFDSSPSAADLGLPEPYASRLISNIFDGRLFDVSSSEIRERIATGRDIRYLVSDPVADYIQIHGLYRT